MQASKMVEVAGLGEKIELLLGGGPHLVDHRGQVHGVAADVDDMEQRRGPAEQANILGHLFDDTGALDLDHHGPAVGGEAGPVYLGDGGGTQGRFLDAQIPQLIRAQLLLQHPGYLAEGHGRNLAAQLSELLAIGAGQQILPHGEDLAHLDEGRTQPLQQLPELGRVDALGDLLLVENGQNFPQTGGIADPPGA